MQQNRRGGHGHQTIGAKVENARTISFRHPQRLFVKARVSGQLPCLELHPPNWGSCATNVQAQACDMLS
jgi:hypothetical protein